jgi:putative glycosyltransferase
MQLSIVSTLYNSSATVDAFVRRSCAVGEALYPNAFEIILVDDGSTDDSLNKAIGLCPQYPQLAIVELSRNFGHHNALREGLQHAKGELIWLLDSDLEEAPELLPEFLNQLESNNLDVVIGVQKSRKGGWRERFFGGWFWRIFNKLTDAQVPEDVSTARLMRRHVVEALLLYRESAFFFSGIQSLAGFKTTTLSFEKKSKGYSAYTLRKRTALMLNAVTSFSSKPLLYILAIGVGISCLAVFSGMVLLLRKWVFQVDFQTGWTSLILSIWFLSGVLMMMTGILGLYISKLFQEVKQRPNVIVRRVYRGGSSV